jgi:hypothetical protein
MPVLPSGRQRSTECASALLDLDRVAAGFLAQATFTISCPLEIELRGTPVPGRRVLRSAGAGAGDVSGVVSVCVCAATGISAATNCTNDATRMMFS